MATSAGASSISFAFVFPSAWDSTSPSLPVARRLVELGHAVHYLCRESLREAVEATGAAFHSDAEAETELYQGRPQAGVAGAMEALKREHGLQQDSAVVSLAKLWNVQTELILPGVLRFLRRVGARAVVYCPIMNPEAFIAASALGIPSVALLTTAGPGSLATQWGELIARERLDPCSLLAAAMGYEPNMSAILRLEALYGAHAELSWLDTLGYSQHMARSAITLVTTIEDLQDPMTPELQRRYQQSGASFAFVGPLSDKAGAAGASAHMRCAGSPDAHPAAARSLTSAEDVLAKVASARAAGRRVVLVCLGAAVTGDDAVVGWRGRRSGPDGRPRGLTGRQLCHAAWAGAIDAFGTDAPGDGPLLVIAVGPQRDALEGLPLAVPPNALCAPSVPRADVLGAGVDLFLTHGGRTSFAEAMAHAAPVVVCPSDGEQLASAQKAEWLGAGAWVDRPDPDAGLEAEAAASYRVAICRALREVSAAPACALYKAAAARCAERLRRAGGVERAAELVLAAAAPEAPGGRVAPKAVAAQVSPEHIALASAGA